ncbi:MAG TPA: hypothetical protein VGI43_15945 [Mucilaginibacter sp.]|jgi:hypothetical protein
MTETIKKFWNWFEENNKPYLLLDEADEEVRDQLLQDLETHLHEYCDELWFELGGMPGEEQELIITAEGNTDFFEQVEALLDSAPVINGWRFTAFIQPVESENTINYEGVELKRDDLWFMPLQSASNPKSIGIRVCAPNYDFLKENDWFKNAVYKMLDTVLGEKSFAIDINHVDYGQLPEKPEEHGMIELAELPAYIKWKKSKQNS